MNKKSDMINPVTESKGITLIALVVTIIILVILSTISILSLLRRKWSNC